jgi:hypothetical protein
MSRPVYAVLALSLSAILLTAFVATTLNAESSPIVTSLCISAVAQA